MAPAETSDIEHGRSSFQLMMTCFVKEITQTYHDHSFPDKVRRKVWRGAAKDAN
jgi:hypothetical protein